MCVLEESPSWAGEQGAQGPSGLWSKRGGGASVFEISEGRVKKELVT